MRIVLAQLSGTPGDLEANLVLLEEVLQQHQGRDVVVFPELFLPGYYAGRNIEFAIDKNSPAMVRVGLSARRSNTNVIFGFSEQRPEGISNSVAHVDSSGELVATYRKAQLFGEGEQAAFVAGESLVITEINGVKAGLLNCFDVEFPEHARALAAAGAEILITVAANMEPYGPDHALAVRARAVENRRTHVYVNRVQKESDLQFLGESCVIVPSGEAVLLLGEDPEIAELEVDLDQWANPAVDYLRHVRALPVAGSST